MRGRRLVLGALVLGLALAAGPPAAAQINSPGARTLFARHFLYRVDARWMRLGAPARATDVLAWENLFVVGLPRSLTAMAALPVVRTDGADGLADPLFLVQYDGLLRRNRPGGFTRLAGFAGVRAPWGAKALSAGAPAVLSGLVLTHATPRWFWNGDVQWTATRPTDDGVDPGDVVQLDASAMFRLRRYPRARDLFLVLELNAIREGAARLAASTPPTSGRTVVFVSPGVEWFVRPNVVLELGAQLPVHETRRPVEHRWTLVGGLRYVY